MTKIDRVRRRKTEKGIKENEIKVGRKSLRETITKKMVDRGWPYRQTDL